MSCRVLQENDLIPKYLNGQLDPVALDQAELHILECQSCREAVELLLTVRDQVAAHAHEIRSYSVPRGRLRWSWVAVAALIVIVSGIGVREFVLFQGAAARVAQQEPPKMVQQEPLTKSEIGTPVAASSSPPRRGVPEDHGSSTSPAPGVSKPKRDDMAASAHNLFRRDTTPLRPGNPAEGHAVPEIASDASRGAAPANSNHVNSSGTRGEDKTAVASSVGNAPPSGEIANPATDVVTKAGSANEPSNTIAQLAAVRPLPYTFSGVAGSQPSKGGTTRVGHTPTSTVSGNAGTNPRSGTSGFSTPQDFFQDAMTAYVERRYNASADLLVEAVRLDPQFAEANLYLGICRLLQGKAGDAVPPLQSASLGKKPAVVQAAHFYAGKAYLQLGKLAQAETEFHAAAAISGRLTGDASSIIPRLQAIRHAADVTPDMNK
jgi:hypothetical protein